MSVLSEQLLCEEIKESQNSDLYSVHREKIHRLDKNSYVSDNFHPQKALFDPHRACRVLMCCGT